ncbi:AlkZ family DNA glycosylase [Mycolicibacterium flavescens]|uniref:Winged helix DNA-binding domain-containing protein n=1 Tax=Mycolicibacterium flavescens TaxID=1776 RepID=A0A1E3RQ74_MYCFV|nr:winged helix DNA-binding domain-containing protein [Mycolicibacterium flavescens]MCV7279338.1 AlkZ family DNA glycosylase [Mycolicibacterium flavescens]ODQ92045.1 hypothetical protein BHQ18_04190 [Mycolicibacterium flavescens]
MRSFTVDERRARLARRHFLCAPAGSVDDVVRGLIALHATDPATPYLSLWSRLPGFSVADLDAALYHHRGVVKHLAMRRTLWAVPTDDLPAVQCAASDRVAGNERRRLIADAQKAGVCVDGAKWLAAARTAVLDYLTANGPTDAKSLRTALPELAGTYDPAPGKTWGGETPLAPRVLTVIAAEGDIVRGPNDGRWTTSRPRWVPTRDWIEPGEPVDPEAARATLLRRWLSAFGPATVTDVKWWFGHTLTWARQGLRDVDAVEVDLDGTSGYVLPDDLEPEPEPEPWVALLPGLDVTTMGWFDRGWYLDGLRERVFDRNGNAGPTAWCDGRVVGAWAQDDDGRVEVRLAAEVGRAAAKALQQRAAELTEWLDGVRINPRFPSPLSKSG